MPRFTYRAKDSALHLVEGTIEADNESAAISRLGSQGVFPISIAEEGARVSSEGAFSAARRISSRHVTSTTRQLADLLGGGLPLLSALTLLGRQTEHPALKRVIQSVTASVQEGRSLSESLSQHPAVFPPLFVSMVSAGEAGGGLEQSLTRLADLGESEAELRSRVISASVYPIVVLVLASLAVAVLISYVVPQLSLVFVESGQLLPLPTRILLAISQTLNRWWWAMAAVAVFVLLFVHQWYASPRGKTVLDRLFVSLPGIGTLVRKLEIARFTRSLGVLVGQGVPVLRALNVVASNISNDVLRQAVAGIEEAVREGSTIAAALGNSGQFPTFVSNMVAVGEESGTVDGALIKVASTYDREVDRVIRALTTVLEPLLLVVVGGVVLFIVLSILLPVFQLGLVTQ